MFYALQYVSVHIINYGLLRPNDVHTFHHKYYNVNYGPDPADIAFNTKYCPRKSYEDMSHNIPNLIISLFLVILVRYVYTINKGNKTLRALCEYILYILILIMIVISFILHNKPVSKTIYSYIDKLNSNPYICHKNI
jgi:hypothetical protein